MSSSKKFTNPADIGPKTETAVEVKAETPAKKTETAYPVSEFAANAAKLFGVNSDMVTAAFFIAGKTEATKTEAKAIVEAFRTKEVK